VEIAIKEKSHADSITGRLVHPNDYRGAPEIA
jgi:hypothetical protein